MRPFSCDEPAAIPHHESASRASAAEYLVQGAKYADTFDQNSSARMWSAACDLIVSQTGEISGSVLGGEILQAARDWFLKAGRVSDALELAVRHIVVLKHHEQRASLHKAYCAQTILELTIGDVVRADRSYLEHLQDSQYLHADEAAIAEDLIRSFKMNDAELLEKTLANHRVTFLDPPITQLAKALALTSDFDVDLPVETKPPGVPASVDETVTPAVPAADIEPPTDDEGLPGEAQATADEEDLGFDLT